MNPPDDTDQRIRERMINPNLFLRVESTAGLTDGFKKAVQEAMRVIILKLAPELPEIFDCGLTDWQQFSENGMVPSNELFYDGNETVYASLSTREQLIVLAPHNNRVENAPGVDDLLRQTIEEIKVIFSTVPNTKIKQSPYGTAGIFGS